MIQKKIDFDDVTKKSIKEHNPDGPQIPDHPCKILIVGSSESGKTNALLNLINNRQISCLNVFHQVPLISFSNIDSISMSVDNSSFPSEFLKAASHANPGTERNLTGSK